MSLLNSFFYIIECYHNTKQLRGFYETEPTSGLALLMHNFAKTNDIWYCMITNEKSLTSYNFKELIGEEILPKIMNKEAYLVIDLPFEPFLLCIDLIYQELVKKENIPASQIIFMSNMYDAFTYSKAMAEKYACEPINVFYFSALEYMLNQYVRSWHQEQPTDPEILKIPYVERTRYPKDLEKKQYQKAFLNLNRRWRMHRPLLILLMWYYKLLDKGFVSFGPTEEKHDWNFIWDGLKVGAIDNPELQKIIHESEEIKNLKPLYLDTEELHINRPQQSRTTDYFYENSYFSVVSETTFYHREYTQNSRFITEKTFKAIAMKHPFLLVTIPHSLQVLKRLGYKTFSPWIDESYDTELNDNKRMFMIVKEIERLSNLPPDQFNEFIDNCAEICEHNYQLLRNQQNFIYTEDWHAL